MTDSNWPQYRETDPFSDIAPSLLNSDDIYRYAQEGCLVSDFEKSRLLPAGYRLRFLGELVYWKPVADGKLKRVEKRVTKDKPVTLHGNSIAYLHMEEEFRMPQYIAARFNLRITHVHQGLLLGTGPLVDPGFSGRILVPLHNLTDNDYVFMGGDSFIHVEFTKLNPLPRWEPSVDMDSISDDYVEFPKKKIISSPDKYFRKANVLDNKGVVSNLNPLTLEVQSALSDFRDLSDTVKRRQTTFNWIGFGGILALLALLYSALTLVLDAHEAARDAENAASQSQTALKEAQAVLQEIAVGQESTSPAISSTATSENVAQSEENVPVNDSAARESLLQPEPEDVQNGTEPKPE